MACKLCNNPVADQENSHIIPFSLIKTMVTPGEKGRTEKDVSFDLSLTGTTCYFFGRDLREDEIYELLGRDLTEEEIAQNSNPFTVDNLLCTSCEKKFGRLESLYSKLLAKKISENQNDFIELDHTNSLLLKVFIYSIIWRLGVSNYNGYSIHESILSRLSVILQQCLSLDESEIISKVKENKVLIQDHKVSISYFNNIDHPKTRFVFFDLGRKNPNYYFFNGLIVVFYYKKGTLLKKGNSFFGLEKLFDRKTIYKTENTILFASNENIVLKGVNEMASIIAKADILKFKKDFEEIFFRIKNKVPNIKIVRDYLTELLSDDYEYIDKYSVTRIVSLIKKHCI
ncbi:MAG TPA: hypothetical protein VK835_07980 [Bacteroidia bacterium]|jgi:hypothetical protein|nr:hypothetical protein [Bacteroidia bacterium]